MTDLKIEIASKRDLPQILALQKEAYVSEASIYDDFSIPPLQQTLKEIENELEDNVFLKVDKDGEIIGSVRAMSKEGTCYIGKLIVSPAHQNRGIGKKLLSEIETLFPDVNRYELFTGAKSLKNLHIYKTLGYQNGGTNRITRVNAL